jgi:hypothetical protein
MISKFDSLIEKYNSLLNENSEGISKFDPSRIVAVVEITDYLKDVQRLTKDENLLLNAFNQKFDQVRKGQATQQSEKPKAAWEIERDKYSAMAQEINPQQEEETFQSIEAKAQDILKKPLKHFEHKLKTKNMPFLDTRKFNLGSFRKTMAQISPEVFSNKPYDVFVYQISHRDPSLHLICTKVPSKEKGKEVVIWLRALNSYKEYEKQLDEYRHNQGKR